MKKKIQKIGTSKGIIFNKEEQEAYKVNVGDFFEVKIKKCEDIPRL